MEATRSDWKLRLEMFREKVEYNQDRFGRLLGYSSGASYNNMIKGIAEMGTDKLIRLNRAFPTLDMNWLLAGTGTMEIMRFTDVTTDYEVLYGITRKLDEILEGMKKSS